MKKILIIALAAFLLVGCGKESTKHLDLDLAKTNINGVVLDKDFTFADEENINNSEVLEVYGIDKDLLDEYLYYIPLSVVDPSMYLIVKPKEGNEAVVKYQIKDMFDKYYNSYNNYYPEEAKMIESRMEKELDGYLIYIVSSDNNAVYDAITKSLK